MKYIEGRDRHQKIIFPETLDEYIKEDNPVRFIDAYIDQLDLHQLGFQHSILSETGRPPYHPSDMLKLYVYGYLNRIRSSRSLEKEAGRNLELMWLIGKLQPDFKTIADFRKDNLKAIKMVCREFALLCKRLELFGGELVAIDGSKFKADNSKKRNYNEQKLKRALKEIETKIDQYTEEMDEEDAKEKELEQASPTAEELKKKISQIKERQQKYQTILEELLSSGESQISLTDSDSRSMPVGQGVDVCYNVQSAVDEKHKLIVVADVTNEVTDQAQLRVMAKEAKAVLEVERLDVVADTGYYNGSEIKACEEIGITCYIPKANTSANTKLGLFGKEQFSYDKEKDCYHCPAGKELTYRYTTIEQGREIRYYSTTACKTCPLKTQCTRNKRNRRITRWVHEEVLERMQKRMAAEPEKYKKRNMLVEHPFGTIKRWMDQGYFLMRGIEKVMAEFSLSVLAYNIKRVITILGIPAMVAAIS